MMDRADPWIMEIWVIMQTALASCCRCIAEWKTVTNGMMAVIGVVPGGQHIGPTSRAMSCEFVDVPDILLGGASPSPPNPTGIGGVVGNH